MADIILERPLSKSQLEAWRSCQRRWGWPYLENVGGSNRFADLGTLVHKQLEGWLARGVNPDPTKAEGRIAEAGLHLLPVPRTKGNIGLYVESEVFTITQQAIYHGFGDFIESPQIPPEFLQVDEDGDVVDSAHASMLPVIGDHKSTVDFKWALTEDQLETDIQANIYTRAAMQLFGVDEAVAKWVYYRTRHSPKAHMVQRRMRRERVDQVFAEIIDPIAAEIQAAWEQKPKVLELEPNYRSCSDYGGCPHRDNCNISAKGRFIGMVAHQSLAEKMKAKAKGTKPEPASEPSSPPAGGINPPEAAKLPPLKERMKALAAANQAKPAETPAGTASAPKEPEKAAEAPKQAELPHTEKKAETPTEEPKAPPVDVAALGFVLCFGVLPIRGAEVLHASDIIREVKNDLEGELGLLDYRLAEFGKGPGLLAAGVRQAIADTPPTGYVFLDARTDEGRHTYDAFAERASVIIRGL